MAGTPQQPWPIRAAPDTNKKNKNKQEILKNTAIQEKLYSYIQQVIGRAKGRALLHFKQIDLNERGFSQS